MCRDLQSDQQNWSQQRRLQHLILSHVRGGGRVGVTAALCVVCLLYICIKAVVGRVLVISARLRERPGLSRSLPAHQLLGIFGRRSGRRPPRPTRPLAGPLKHTAAYCPAARARRCDVGVEETLGPRSHRPRSAETLTSLQR